MAPEEYLIHELAKKAGVSVRTIRYYIDEGVLPPPDSKGRYASYTQDYLDRLELIRRLKDAFLPLKEIRERIAGLSPSEVRGLLKQMESESQPAQPTPAPTAAAKPLSSALEYINQIMEAQTKSILLSRPAPPADITAQQPTPAFRQEDSTARAQTWKRITLAAGVELHILQPASPGDQRRIQRLIEFARSLFTHPS